MRVLAFYAICGIIEISTFKIFNNARGEVVLTYDLSGREPGMPLYEYIYRSIRRDILSGTLPAGEKLPGRRALAEHLGVSVITVEAAYSQLEAEGCVEARPRRGFYVCARAALPPAEDIPAAGGAEEARDEWRLDLRSNRVDASLFPVGIWSRLTRRVLSEDPDAMLRSVPHAGLYELREAIAAYLRGDKGMPVTAGQVVVGAGAEFLYLMLAQLFRGAAFALEDPGYPKIRQAYSGSGAECLPVRLDEQGAELAALRASGAGVLHISPAHQYPTGLVTPLPRRQELLAWARDTGGYIIEDDYDSELGFAPRPLPTLSSIDRAGRVIYVNTFSQTIAPGMRVGYLVLPERLLDTWGDRLGFYSCAVPTLEQHVLSRFISGGFYERHLARLRKACREKRSAVLEAFRRSDFASRVEIAEPGAGLHFLMRVETDASDADLRGRAAELGLRLGFLSDYAFDAASAQQHVLVINYAGLGGERLGEAVELLGRVLK